VCARANQTAGHVGFSELFQLCGLVVLLALVRYQLLDGLVCLPLLQQPLVLLLLDEVVLVDGLLVEQVPLFARKHG
jgi:hypothetical protein